MRKADARDLRKMLAPPGHCSKEAGIHIVYARNNALGPPAGGVPLHLSHGCLIVRFRLRHGEKRTERGQSSTASRNAFSAFREPGMAGRAALRGAIFSCRMKSLDRARAQSA